MSHRELLEPLRRLEWDDATWARTLDRFEARRSKQIRFRTRQSDARACGYKTIAAWEQAGRVFRPTKPDPQHNPRPRPRSLARLSDLAARGYVWTGKAWRYPTRRSTAVPR